jgi:hypothetical protein
VNGAVRLYNSLNYEDKPGGIIMCALTLAVSSREETNRRFLQAFEGEPQGNLLTFESPALLFTLLTAERWDLLKMMTGAGATQKRHLLDAKLAITT